MHNFRVVLGDTCSLYETHEVLLFDEILVDMLVHRLVYLAGIGLFVVIIKEHAMIEGHIVFDFTLSKESCEVEIDSTIRFFSYKVLISHEQAGIDLVEFFSDRSDVLILQ